MKLAEALMLRSDYQTKIEKLKSRIINNVKIQEGEEVSEDPQQLMDELEITLTELEKIICRINNTNNITMLNDNMTLSSALTKRDIISNKIHSFEYIVNSASINQSRVSRSEVKFVTTIKIRDIQKNIDFLCKEYRELDTKIQEKNWLTDLIVN